MSVRCEICPHSCVIGEGRTGFCGARGNRGGAVVCTNYGRLTAMALDPIEKKPLYRFMPGSRILSVGSYGCNLRCPFCQNCGISMADEGSADTAYMPPEQLADKALALVPQGNIGVAFTYNEPLIGFEYVADCARLVRACGLKNVLVTNGYVCERPLLDILPLIDAMNIDLKGFTEEFYRRLSGDLDTVKTTIALAAGRCHVEVTTLVIPGENDGAEEMEALAAWLAGVGADIPLHLSRFFPRYKYAGKTPTPKETLYRLRDVAQRHLKYVYLGNI
ncbi:pyruvate formate lyase activating enzyme [Sporobacter termitidis DSM 10068]|uniref:Pyruvate formate lyase activating enzyme n=1 Tax=Sporobacter termitidis DSM 10068 TaxID=1123282 RepID=A0A1M5ZA46_9FIRM|nr:AmmeMemoRadiSam system radical SAM enzyme [Sporobacter termitidis]SHI21090.1 pyruvate formate lyase activating enzyme [Sporobacter termitidis DSM 10068]